MAIAARFPESYRGNFSPAEALRDTGRIAQLERRHRSPSTSAATPAGQPTQAALKIHHLGAPMALSRRVPVLENMGFQRHQRAHLRVRATSAAGTVFCTTWTRRTARRAIDLADAARCSRTSSWPSGTARADNDGFNALAQTAGLVVARDRAAARLWPLSAADRHSLDPGYIAGALHRYPGIARALLRAVRRALRAGLKQRERRRGQHLEADRGGAGNVASLDEDTIFRAFRNLIEATCAPISTRRSAMTSGRSLAIKLESAAIDGLPSRGRSARSSSTAPRWRACICASARSRAAACAGRTGRRTSAPRCSAWSRRSTSRTPSSCRPAPRAASSRSGCPPAQPRRDFEAGTAAYIGFISGCCRSPTTSKAARSCRRQGVVRHDGDDPYLVVAADKGTATFSDTANGIALKHGFWLGDAFASGGSAGYDHKAMGITARGAWEAVKRHFREMDVDIQTSRSASSASATCRATCSATACCCRAQTRLVAAFDHRDIFIDPDPDPAARSPSASGCSRCRARAGRTTTRRRSPRAAAIFSRSQKPIDASAGGGRRDRARQGDAPRRPR